MIKSLEKHFRWVCCIITGDVGAKKETSTQTTTTQKSDCVTDCCLDCAREHCKIKPLPFGTCDEDALQKCKIGCGNGALSYQANAFVTTALLFMFYFIN